MKSVRQRSWLLILLSTLLVLVALTTFFNLQRHVDTHSALEAERYASDHVQTRLRTRISHLEAQLAALQTSPNTTHSLPHSSTPQETDFTTKLNRYHIRYWRESESEWPADPLPATSKFVTFSPWRGGFNNIRMSLEMAVAAAFALNRTLVMPPAYKMYLRGASSLESYFDYDALRKGIPVIKYEEFLLRVPEFKKRQGKMVPSEDDLHSSVERYYKGLQGMDGVQIHDESVWGKNAIGESVVYCVPTCPDRPGAAGKGKVDAKMNAENFYFDGFMKRRKKTFNAVDLVDPLVIHFPQDLLGHFYTMFWFKDPQQNRRMKRIIRDHVHFREEIVELAERIIERLGHFKYSCLHVRRNEFQFKDVWTPAEKIVKNVQGLWKKGEQIYISTDELSKGKDHKNFDPTAMTKRRKHSWFTPMLEAWGTKNVHFLDEYFDELIGPEVPKIWIGCIETSKSLRDLDWLGSMLRGAM